MQRVGFKRTINSFAQPHFLRCLAVCVKLSNLKPNFLIFVDLKNRVVSQINKLKIFNDPIYGFISIPNALIYDLIQHPYFQRLRRISQM